MSQEDVEIDRAVVLRPPEPHCRSESRRLRRRHDLRRVEASGFGIYRGFNEFNVAWTQYRDTFDNWWIEVEELLEGKGSRVFVAVRDGGRMRASGSEVRKQVFHVCELRAGKIAAWAVFLDRSEAIEAAGLRE